MDVQHSPDRSLDHSLNLALAGLEQQKLSRRLRVIDSMQGTRITICGRELSNFSSNDYLGLAAHPALAEAMSRAWNSILNGSRSYSAPGVRQPPQSWASVTTIG